MWFGSSELEESHCAVREIDFVADEPMRPDRLQRERMSQLRDRALIVRARDVDHRSLERPAEPKGPVPGKRTTRGCVLDAAGRAFVDGFHEAVGLLPDFASESEREPLPDLLLPPPVVGFDGGLKTIFAGRCEDRRHPQLQAHPRDPAEDVGMLMGTLKVGVVVELHVLRQAICAPMPF